MALGLLGLLLRIDLEVSRIWDLGIEGLGRLGFGA